MLANDHHTPFAPFLSEPKSNRLAQSAEVHKLLILDLGGLFREFEVCRVVWEFTGLVLFGRLALLLRCLALFHFLFKWALFWVRSVGPTSRGTRGHGAESRDRRGSRRHVS